MSKKYTRSDELKLQDGFICIINILNEISDFVPRDKSIRKIFDDIFVSIASFAAKMIEFHGNKVNADSKQNEIQGKKDG